MPPHQWGKPATIKANFSATNPQNQPRTFTTVVCHDSPPHTAGWEGGFVNRSVEVAY